MAGSPGTFDGGHGSCHKHARFSASFWEVSPLKAHPGSALGILLLVVVPAVAEVALVSGAVGLLAPVVVGQAGLVPGLHTVAAGNWTVMTESEKKCKTVVDEPEALEIDAIEVAGPAEQTGDTGGCLSAGRGTRAEECAWRWWWAAYCHNRNCSKHFADDWT